MEKELVDVINKTYGQFKNEIISLSEEDYKKFSTRFIETSKTLKEVGEISCILAVMDKWRKKC